MNFVFEDIENKLNLISANTLRDAAENNYRYNQSPLSNDINDLWNTNRELWKEYNPKIFSVEKRPRKYIIPVGLNESPSEWAEGFDIKTKTAYSDLIFSNLRPEYKKDLQIGRAFLLLDASLEGYHEDWMFDYIYAQCKQYKIAFSRIILVTGSVLLEERYSKWSKKNKIKDNLLPLGYPHFLYEVYKNTWTREFVDYAPVIGYDQHLQHKGETTKLFSCTNKRPRPHRVWLYNELSKAGLIEKGVVSMSDFDTSIEYKEGTVKVSNSELSKLKDTLPMEPYGVSFKGIPTTFFINRFNEKHALDTWINVVSEARYYDGENTIFLSEKIFKAIALEQPFIIVGNKGSLSSLRKLGFKTFSKYFNETYDTLGYKDRIAAVVELLKEIDLIEDKVGWYKDMKEVLKHNSQLLKVLSKDKVNPHIDRLFKHFHSTY